MLQSLSPFTIYIALLSGLVAASFGCLLVWTRWRLYSSPPKPPTVELAMNAHRALAVLHALIMALVFAQAEIDYTRARESVWREADLLEGVFRDLRLFETEAADEASLLVADYTKAVIESEWDLLSRNQLSPDASKLFDQAFRAVLGLDATTSSEVWLRNRSLEDLSTLSGLRHARFFEANDKLPAAFWLIIILGYVLQAGLFSVYRFTLGNLSIIATYSFFFGAVSYLIFAFQDPFDGHLRVKAQPMVLLYQGVMEPLVMAERAPDAG